MADQKRVSLDISKYFFNNSIIFKIYLLILSFICYGLMSHWQNFYHDEIPILWFHLKIQDISLFFEENRPLLGIIYKIFATVFGSHALAWHLFGVLSRWINALSVFWLIQKIWPNTKSNAKQASLLMLVYPAFQVQFSSMIFSIGFLLFSSFLLSLYLTVKAITQQENHAYLTLAAIFLSAISLFTSEYFFTLEIIRYVIIWLIIRIRNKNTDIRKLFSLSVPYIGLFLAAIIWRLAVQSSETVYKFNLFDNLIQAFFISIKNLISTVIGDISYTGIFSWFQTFYPDLINTAQSEKIRLAYYLIIIFTIISAYIILSSTEKGISKSKHHTHQILFLSIVSLFLAGIPFWLAGLPVTEQYFYTRWTIPFMFGSALFLLSLMDILFNHKTIKTGLFCVLVGFSVGTQFLAANSFRHDWEKQNQFYWQLSWRIPDIEENTVFFSNLLDFKYENSDQISMGINFVFSGAEKESKIPYFLFYLPERIGTSVLPEIMKDLPLSGKRYYSKFNGNTSNSIIIDFQHPNCLKILDPEIDTLNPNIDPQLKESLVLSNNQSIKPYGAIQPDIQIVGKEPEKNWCYFFEKADLAVQFQNWSEIPPLLEKIQRLGLNPRDGREWFPFIEGMAHNDEWNKAFQITEYAFNKTDKSAEMFCALWDRISEKTKSSQAKNRTLQEIINTFNCQTINEEIIQ